MTEKIALLFPDTEETINLEQLASFVYLFKGAYGLALDVYGDSLASLEVANLEPAAERVLEAAKVIRPDELKTLFNTPLDGNELRVLSIQRQSPMVMVLVGCTVVIALAVVLSGGKISIGQNGLKAELKPLGEGIATLRRALAVPRSVNTGYSLQTTEIQLSREEFGYLMEKVNGEGGFQRFLKELQFRVNRQTRKLPLHPEDVERIVRHGRNRGKGGFQARLSRIFGRHFGF